MGSGSELLEAGKQGLISTPAANRRRRGRVANRASRPQTVNEHLNSLPPQVREMVENAMAFDRQRKLECIRIITANKNNQFRKSFLATKSLKELRALANLAGQQQTRNSALDQMLVPNYAGQGPVSNAAQGAFDPNDDLLPLPVTLNTNKPVQKKRRRG
jgi:hypothetical protein